MNFEEAEARFRELQARVQRGEPISRAEYEDQVSQLAVQDRNGVLWEINPRTGKWMYFDGAEWVSGTPPGHDTSAVIPMGGRPFPNAPTLTPPEPAPSSPPPPPIMTSVPEMLPSEPTAPLQTPPSPPPSSVRPAPPPPPISAPPVRPASTSVPPRPITPPGASAPPAGPKGSPEPLKPRVRPQERLAPPPVAPPGAAPKAAAERGSPLAVFGPNREWVPLAIGAVVLLLCAMLLFVGGNVALKAFGGTTVTPTRTLVVSLPATPLPTVVRLPTEPPPTPTPESVLAKVVERSVNVRGGPSTKDKIMSSVKQNQQITLIGRNADSTWFQINLAGGAAPGWVFGQTLQIVSGDTNTLTVAGPLPTPTKAAAAATPRPVQPSPTATLAPLGTLPSPTPKAYP